MSQLVRAHSARQLTQKPITSKSYGDNRAIPLTDVDFARGSLQLTSYVRPGKLFTTHNSLVAGEIGELQPGKFGVVCDAVVGMIQAD